MLYRSWSLILALTLFALASPAEEDVFPAPKPPPGLESSQRGTPLEPQVNHLAPVATHISAGHFSSHGDQVWVGLENGAVLRGSVVSDGLDLQLTGRLGDGAAIFRSHGDMVVAGDGCLKFSQKQCGFLSLWSSDGTMKRRWKARRTRVYGLAWSPDGTWLAYGGDESGVEVCRASTGKVRAKLQEFGDNKVSPVTRLVFHGEDLVIGIRDLSLTHGAGDGSCRIFAWHIPSGRMQWIGQPYAKSVHGLALHPSGDRIAVGSPDGPIDLIDLKKNRRVARLTGHPLKADEMAFSADGRLLASGSNWGDVRVWNVEEERQEAFVRGPDGTTLALRFDEHASRLWVLESAKDGTRVDAVRLTSHPLEPID